MTSFTFSAEQVRAAPPEVRRWIEHELSAAVAAIEGPAHDAAEMHAAALAACSAEEAAQVFELIKDNFLLTQVFFELGRDMRSPTAAPLHALDVGDMLRHTRLPDGDRLADCLTAITQVFRQLRNDPEASLFGFDAYGRVFIHETTHASVRHLWQQLLAPHAPAPPVAVDFDPPHLGPSDAVAGHRSKAANFVL